MEQGKQEVSTTLTLSSDCCLGTNRRRSLSLGFGGRGRGMLFLLSRLKTLTGKTSVRINPAKLIPFLSSFISHSIPSPLPGHT